MPRWRRSGNGALEGICEDSSSGVQRPGEVGPFFYDYRLTDVGVLVCRWLVTKVRFTERIRNVVHSPTLINRGKISPLLTPSLSVSVNGFQYVSRSPDLKLDSRDYGTKWWYTDRRTKGHTQGCRVLSLLPLYPGPSPDSPSPPRGRIDERLRVFPTKRGGTGPTLHFHTHT